MKAILFEEFGGSDKLKLVTDAPKPTPAADEVLIRIHFTSVNPVDWKIREGYLKNMMPHTLPIIPGWDAAGVVEAVGGQVKGFAVGDKVYSYARTGVVHSGTYAEYVALKESAVALVPPSLSLDAAASIPLAGLTAWQSLFDFAGLARNQSVLIHAGAGGVGSLAIQFAKVAGASKIFTTASAANHDYVKSLGATHAIDYHKQSFVDAVLAEEKEGVDVVFDCAGGEALTKSFAVVKHGGVFASICGNPNPEEAKKKGLKSGFCFVNPNGGQLKQIADLVQNGKVKPASFQVLPLEQAKEAQDMNQKGHVKGKLVLSLDHIYAV